MSNLKIYIGFFIALSIIVYSGVIFFSSIINSSAAIVAYSQAIENKKAIDSLKVKYSCFKDSIEKRDTIQQKIIKAITARRNEIVIIGKEVDRIWKRIEKLY